MNRKTITTVIAGTMAGRRRIDSGSGTLAAREYRVARPAVGSRNSSTGTAARARWCGGARHRRRSGPEGGKEEGEEA